MMSMISPEGYIQELEDATYGQLIEERDELLEFVKDFEQGKLPEIEWCICPSAEVRYQLYLKYLGLLCKRISEVYNRDVVNGGEE